MRQFLFTLSKRMEKIILLFLFVSALGNNFIIELEDGKIQGVSEKTDIGKVFYAFREIPYASPPVGNLRFAEPILPIRWSGVRDASKNTKICIQMKLPFEDQTPDPRENEDCLYLNVFTPTISTVKEMDLLPVYVYIFGGMMIEGDPTEYNFQGFLDENIVVVTIDFRLSALGTLSTDDGVIPGNLFLKDQTLALKWVNKNIKKFGGDPNKVTIGGHSSGAACVGYHVLNTKSKGLFRAAILQSYSALGPFLLNVTEVAYSFAKRFDPEISTKNTTQLLNLLRTIPAETLNKVDHLKRPDWLIRSTMSFTPPWGSTIENPKFKNAVVVGPMYDNIKNGLFNHVPILTGFTSEEIVVSKHFEERIKWLDGDISVIIHPTVSVKPENKLKLAKELKSIYTQTKTFKENMTGLIKMFSDITFNMGIINNAKLHSKYADVYLYQFSYKGPLNGLEKWKKNPLSKLTDLGNVGHCEELPFLYYYRINSTVVPSQDDFLTRKRLLKIWTNFIKDLNPTPKSDSLLEDITWPKVKPDDVRYLDISTKLSVKKNPRQLVEWTNRLDKYYEQPRYY